MKRNLTALSYLRGSRFSLNESMESQRHDIGEACKRLGIQILEEFSDEGLSTLQPRPGIDRLMERIQSVESVDFVLVRSMTRLTRDLDWFIRFEHELKHAGTKILIGPDFCNRSTRENFAHLVREIVKQNSRRISSNNVTPHF